MLIFVLYFKTVISNVNPTVPLWKLLIIELYRSNIYTLSNNSEMVINKIAQKKLISLKYF